ncbi:prohibitin family protein [Phormidesmis sp. 146-12]
MQLRLSRFTFPKAALIAIGLGALVTLVKSMTIIPTGQVGVVDLFGQVSNQTLDPGVHLRHPFAKVVTFSTQTKEIKETTQAPSKEGLIVNVDVSILYRLDPAKAKQIYQTIGTNYEEVILIPQVRSLIRAATASYESTTLYTTNRDNLSQQLRDSLNKALSDRGVIIEETPLRNVTLPESIQQSIQARLQAEQDSQRMEFVLQKERKESDRKRIEAQGNADAQKILSQSLSDRVLQFRQIEATQKLAESQNAKVIILNGDSKGTPMILQP